MLSVFLGDNLEKKKETLAKLLRQYADREVFYMSEEGFDAESLANFIQGGDLFSNKFMVVIDSVIDTDAGEIVLEKIKHLADSETIFVITEVSILKDATTTLKKYAKDWQTFDLPKTGKPKFNIFFITDAFGARDKKNTWVLLQKALREGVAAEEVLNILIWQTKNLLLVGRSDDMKSSGLSPFVYNKSKSYSRNFKEEELIQISRNLTSFFHESHLGLELGINLESYLLKTL